MTADLPTRECAETATSTFISAEPEIPFNLHPHVQTILDIAERYVDGDLMTWEQWEAISGGRR